MAKYPDRPENLADYDAPNGMAFKIGRTRSGYGYWECMNCGDYGHTNHGDKRDAEIDAQVLAVEHSHACRRPFKPRNNPQD
jgi:hypothetical protein